MKKADPNCLASDIVKVQASFEHWRKTRCKREQIPGKLWQAAIELTEHHKITHISRVLKLNHSDFKKKISASASSENDTIEKKSPFFEFPSFPDNRSDNCIIDLKRDDGSSMQIRLQTIETELPTLIRAFLG